MKKVLRTRIKKLYIALCLSSTVYASDIHLSFDSLFPVTWYQKAFTFSLLVWQQLADLMADNNSATKIPFDEIAGRLAYSKFCLNRMKQAAVILLDDDRDYMLMIVRKIKELVGMIVITKKNEDSIECIVEMIMNIQKDISSL